MVGLRGPDFIVVFYVPTAANMDPCTNVVQLSVSFFLAYRPW